LLLPAVFVFQPLTRLRSNKGKFSRQSGQLFDASRNLSFHFILIKVGDWQYYQ
jgi:hypothetical protein